MLLSLASWRNFDRKCWSSWLGDGKSPSESRSVLRDRRLGISHRRMVKAPLAVHTIDGQAWRQFYWYPRRNASSSLERRYRGRYIHCQRCRIIFPHQLWRLIQNGRLNKIGKGGWRRETKWIPCSEWKYASIAVMRETTICQWETLLFIENLNILSTFTICWSCQKLSRRYVIRKDHQNIIVYSRISNLLISK